MAWVRTPVSLIAFGFTIFQFFEWLRKSMILVGLIALAAVVLRLP